MLMKVFIEINQEFKVIVKSVVPSLNQGSFLHRCHWIIINIIKRHNIIVNLIRIKIELWRIRNIQTDLFYRRVSYFHIHYRFLIPVSIISF